MVKWLETNGVQLQRCQESTSDSYFHCAEWQTGTVPGNMFFCLVHGYPVRWDEVMIPASGSKAKVKKCFESQHMLRKGIRWKVWTFEGLFNHTIMHLHSPTHAHCFARQDNGRQRVHVKRGWDHVCHAWRVLAQACGGWCVCARCGVRFRLAVADFSLCVADVCVFLLPQHASVSSAKKMTRCSAREGDMVVCLYFLFLACMAVMGPSFGSFCCSSSLFKTYDEKVLKWIETSKWSNLCTYEDM